MAGADPGKMKGGGLVYRSTRVGTGGGEIFLLFTICSQFDL